MMWSYDIFHLLGFEAAGQFLSAPEDGFVLECAVLDGMIVPFGPAFLRGSRQRVVHV